MRGWRKSIAVGCVAAVFSASPLVAVQAAELRISFAELSRILNATLSSAKLRLHNAPSSIFSFQQPSSLTIGSTTAPLAIPARTFTVGGSTYAYYLNDINSTKIAFTPAPGALRLAMTFESTGGELLGACVSGYCISNAALPEIQWSSPVVAVDLTPTLVAGSLSLTAKQVDVGGSFTPDCARANGIFTGGVCQVILPLARKSVARLKTDINAGLKDQINSAALQDKIATALRGYLKFGPAGDVKITKVAVEGDGVAITFCLACQTQ
jgi:hypothetical protein